MTRFVLEQRKSHHAHASPGEAEWVVLELPSRKEAGVLRKKGEMFSASSIDFRHETESFDPILVLRMAFRGEQFFIEGANGDLQKISAADLK